MSPAPQVAAAVVLPADEGAAAARAPPFVAAAGRWRQAHLAARPTLEALRAAAARAAAEATEATEACAAPAAVFAAGAKVPVGGRGRWAAHFIAAAPLLHPDGSNRGAL